MTKLTIQLDWKSYTPDRSLIKQTIENLVEAYIKSGDLVELQTQEEKPEETVEEKMVDISKRIWDKKHEQSKLQKLRAELERMKPEYTDGRPYLKWANDTIEQIISLLNELQTQPEEYCYRDKDWKPIEFELAKSWPPLSQVPIEIPEFDYEKLEENVRDVEFEKLDEVRHIMWHIGKQLEAITKHLRENK